MLFLHAPLPVVLHTPQQSVDFLPPQSRFAHPETFRVHVIAIDAWPDARYAAAVRAIAVLPLVAIHLDTDVIRAEIPESQCIQEIVQIFEVEPRCSNEMNTTESQLSAFL